MTAEAIRATGISKRYRLGSASPGLALREALEGLARAPFRRLAGPPASPTADSARRPDRPGLDLWALREVSFSIPHGQVVGLVGANGAGKSVLLKILARVTAPTSGSAIIHGRVGSMLEVGAGFHPELTGRENIALHGALLGMKRAEIARKFDAIVAFSGLERFLETPVKRYSSGMSVRLAFAVAAHLEPEILLVDEVLAVGDEAFQQQCLATMRRLADEGRTLLIVSHQRQIIERLCDRALLIGGGRLLLDGHPSAALAHGSAEAAPAARG